MKIVVIGVAVGTIALIILPDLIFALLCGCDNKKSKKSKKHKNKLKDSTSSSCNDMDKTVLSTKIVQNIELHSIVELFGDIKGFKKLTKKLYEQSKNKNFSRIKSMIENAFGHGSMTSDKYNSVIECAKSVINHNVDHAVNLLAMVDVDEYCRLVKKDKKYKNDGAAIRRLEIYECIKNKVSDLIECNDKIIAAGDHLLKELILQEGTDFLEESDAIIESLTSLADIVKLYDIQEYKENSESSR